MEGYGRTLGDGDLRGSTSMRETASALEPLEVSTSSLLFDQDGAEWCDRAVTVSASRFLFDRDVSSSGVFPEAGCGNETADFILLAFGLLN